MQSPFAGDGFEVLPLHRASECAQTLAAWHVAEWAHLYADWDEARALRELLAEPGDGGLPGWPALNPWLASLYVAPSARRRGIGAALVQAACRAAEGLACPRLYLFTESAQDYFERAGFRAHASAVTQGHPVTVMVRAMDARAQGRAGT